MAHFYLPLVSFVSPSLFSVSLLRLPLSSLSPLPVSPPVSPPSPVQDKLLAQLYLLRIEVVEKVVGGGEEGPDAEDEGEQTAREVPVKTVREEGGG